MRRAVNRRCSVKDKKRGLPGVIWAAELLSILYGLSCAALYAVEMKPVINAQLLGGQYFYNNTDNSFGGFAALAAAPYLKWNDAWSLVPLYSGQYKGTQQVQDLLGGGTLFQDSQDHDVSLKGIRTFDNGLKVKAIGSYGVEWLRETKDEGWSRGLYDNHRLAGGAEAEWSWAQDRFVRMAYDYYAVRFPNYQSLESGQVAGGLGRELAQPDVLNNNNHSLTLAGQCRVPGDGLLEWSTNNTWRHFHDQHVVVLSGDLTPATRQDYLHSISGTATWPVWTRGRLRLLGGGGYTWTQLLSNQNSYDAQKLVFRPDFYGYHAQTLQTRWTLLTGDKPWSLTFQGLLTRQTYTDRPVQDAVGNYGTDKTKVDFASVSLELGYPIAKGFQLTFNTALGWNNSNNHDVMVYQYHYHTASYLAGFSYAY